MRHLRLLFNSLNEYCRQKPRANASLDPRGSSDAALGNQPRSLTLGGVAATRRRQRDGCERMNNKGNASKKAAIFNQKWMQAAQWRAKARAAPLSVRSE